MATSPTASIGGLASGLDTASIIAQLVSIESIPLTQVAKARQGVVDEQSAWTKISTAVSAFADAARDMTISGRLNQPVLKASSDAVTVSGSMPVGTSLSLQVRQLATSAQSAVTGYSSASELVGAGRVTTALGAAALGIGKVSAGPAAAAGDHTIHVTQASAAATSASTTTGPLTVGPGNDSLTVTGSDGVAHTVTIAAGTYGTPDALASAVGAALSGTGVSASVAGGALTLSSGDEGSAATLDISGTFATAAGLTGTAAGKDAILDVDGTSTTVTRITAGQAITIGDFTLTASGAHLSTGTAKSKVIDTTAGTTVSDLASLMSSSDTGVSASVVTLAPGAGGTEILMTSKGTGLAGSVSVDLSGFTSPGAVTQIRAGQDAQVMLGSQLVTRSSNTITDLVPGATLTLAKTTAAGEDVTISSETSPDDLLAKLKKFTAAYNGAYDVMATASKADPTGAKIGPLNGSSQLRSLMNQLASAVQAYGGTGTYTSLSAIGVRMGRDGHLSVDEPAFKTALAKDDQSVTSLLARTGTATDNRVSFLSATDTAAAGPQAVVVTRAAERASATSSSFGTLSADETLTITYGTTKLDFTAAAGATAAEVAASLDSALRTAGMGMTATASGGALVLGTTGYGSTASFSITSTGSGTGLGGVTATGVDAAGTINGVAATGSGQRLTSTDGVSIRVSATSAEVAAAGGSLDLGTLTYSKGIAGAVTDMIASYKAAGGVFATAQDSATSQLKMYDDRTAELQRHIDAYQARMSAQFTALETALARLQSQTPNFASLPNLNP